MVEAHHLDRSTRSLRLLWLIDSLNLGGAEALIPVFARALDPARVKLVVACLKTIGGNPIATRLAADGVKVVNLHARNLQDVSAFRRLTRLMRIERVDIVHAHLTYASIWAALAARRTRVPAVTTLHLPALGADSGTRDRVRERLMLAGLRHWVSRVVSVSDAVRGSFAGRLDPARVVVVRNGVEVEGFLLACAERDDARAELGIVKDAPLVSTVSVLREGKGLDVLLRAAARVLGDWPQARFLLAGSGPLEAPLRAQAAALGLGSRLVFAGYREDVPRILAASDLFVLPSLHDALPTVVMEAMAAGLPVVASRVGGIPELVADGETGILTAPGDDGALAAAVGELLRDPVRAQAMGGMGRLRVHDELSSTIWAGRLLELYEESLTEAGK